MKFIPLKLENIERLTADAVLLTLNISGHEDEFSFKPGQYITFCFNLKNEDLRRSYSICSAPQDDVFQVAVKEVEQGRVSTHANRELTAGTVMQVLPPQGNFVFEANAALERHIVLFAAGSGITPMLSIAKSVLQDEPKSHVTLFYGNKTKDAIMFYQELDALAEDSRMDVYHVLSDGSLDVPLFSGRINFGKTLELLYSFVKDDLPKEYYICGPSGMMTSVKNALEDNGVEKEHIHLEYFENPGQNAEPRPTIAPPVEELAFEGSAHVEVLLDDETFTFDLPSDGQSLLDAAIKAGADAPFSCQGGVCTTCRAKLLQGTVRMDSNFALTDQELKDGYILTCQSHPSSKKVTISYDE